MLDEDAGFLERVGVQQKLDPLAGGQPPLSVELGDALLAAPFEDGLAAPAQLFDGVTAGGQEGRSGFRNRRERSRSAMLPEVTVVAQSARGPPGAISKPGFLRWGPERPG